MQLYSSMKVTQMDRMVKGFGMLAYTGQGIEYSNWNIKLQMYKDIDKP